MRAREFLREDYNGELSADLDNILVGAKAAGINDIDPNAVVNQLQKMGYSVDVNSLITLLQGNPVVQNASPEGIRVTDGDSTGNVDGNAEDSADQVDRMAQQASQKGLK